MRPQLRDEAVQFHVPGIGNCPVIHSGSTPVRKMIALLLVDMRRGARVVARPYIKIDRVQLVSIDHHSHRPPIRVIQPPTDQGINLYHTGFPHEAGESHSTECCRESAERHVGHYRQLKVQMQSVLRFLQLGTALVLLIYLLLHPINHALGI
jgi:hypothetical protein